MLISKDGSPGHKEDSSSEPCCLVDMLRVYSNLFGDMIGDVT